MSAVRYQVGAYGAGGEWHPATEYTETYATREEAEWVLSQLDSDNPPCEDVTSIPLMIREVQSVGATDTIGVGDWVVGGTVPSERDHGRIVSIDGDIAMVAWASGCTTSCDISSEDVEVYAEWSAAKARHEALDAADDSARASDP